MKLVTEYSDLQAKHIALTLWINSQPTIFLPVTLYRSLGGNSSVF